MPELTALEHFFALAKAFVIELTCLILLLLTAWQLIRAKLEHKDEK